MRNLRTLLIAGIVLVAIAAFVACAPSDQFLTAKVEAKLSVDPTVRGLGIQVETKDHVVTLTGNVDNKAAKDRALELARTTKGVQDVTDMISVRLASGEGDAPEPGRTVGEGIDDAALTVAVKARLLEDPQVKGLAIDVDTREGVVFLTGTVRSEAEKERAVILARETKRVKGVQANLSIGKS